MKQASLLKAAFCRFTIVLWDKVREYSWGLVIGICNFKT